MGQQMRMMSVRQLSCLVLAEVFSSFAAQANQTIRIDKREHIEKQQYAITIAGEHKSWGHAFIVFSKEDDKRQMSTQEVVGFYPQESKNNIQALFGRDRGRIVDDSRTRRDVSAVILVDKEQYDKASLVYYSWKKSGNYTLLVSDCTTFVGEVARSIGLKTPNRLIEPFPQGYVEEIIKLDEPDRNARLEKRAQQADRAAGQARERAARAHRLAERAKSRRRDLAAYAAVMAFRSVIEAARLDQELDVYEAAIGRQHRIEARENAAADAAGARARDLRSQIKPGGIPLVNP